MKLLVILLLIAIYLQGQIITEVGGGSQRAVGLASGVGSTTKAYPGNVTAGSLLTTGGAVFNSGGAPGAVVVTDTIGTAYTVISFVVPALIRAFTAYGIAPSSGANTVTVNPTGSADIGFAIDEFQGVSATPLDVNGGNTGGTSTTPADTITTITANDLVIGVASWDNAPTVTVGAGYTLIGENESTTFQPFSMEFAVVTTAQLYTVDWLLGSSELWGAMTLAFKPAAVNPPRLLTIGVGK